MLVGIFHENALDVLADSLLAQQSHSTPRQSLVLRHGEQPTAKMPVDVHQDPGFRHGTGLRNFRHDLIQQCGTTARCHVDKGHFVPFKVTHLSCQSVE